MERTFAYRVAHNRGLTYRARHRDDDRLDDWPGLPDPAPTPDRHLDRVIEREWLLAAMRRLPPALLQAMTLHLEGLSNGEAADVLGISENTVAVRLTRGRAALRTLLGTEERTP
jgi:RNA polymerase sigma-70 factor (ECF subfamily)